MKIGKKKPYTVVGLFPLDHLASNVKFYSRGRIAPVKPL